jgi:hypothetical protein
MNFFSYRDRQEPTFNGQTLPMNGNIHALAVAVLFMTPVIRTNAQILFEYGDLAVPGDAVMRYHDTLPTNGPGPSGAGQLWDMSNAQNHFSRTTLVSSPSSTPFGGSFTTSNLATTEDDGITYAYLSSTPTSLIVRGAAGDFLGDGQQLTVPFSNTLLIHNLPRTLGHAFTDTYAFEVIAAGDAFGVHSIRLRHRGNVVDTTDGSGYLTTPVGTYSVLRVKNTDVSTDSIWVKLFSFAPWSLTQVSSGTRVTYSWLAKETKLPVGEMRVDSLGSPTRFIFTSIEPQFITGLSERLPNQLQVWPNPARGTATIILEDPSSAEQVEIYSADGRLIAAPAVNGLDRIPVDTQDWPSGCYLVRLVDHQGRSVLATRMMVE